MPTYNFNGHILSDLNFDDIDFSQPVDALFVDNTLAPNTLDSDFLLETGKYKLTIGNPTGIISNLESSFTASKEFINPETGQFETKTVKVYKWDYDVQNNKLHLYIDYHNFAVTALMVYGVIAIVLVVAGAIATNSVLEKVEKVTGGISDTIKGNPAIWAIIAIFLIPVMVTGIKYFKKL